MKLKPSKGELQFILNQNKEEVITKEEKLRFIDIDEEAQHKFSWGNKGIHKIGGIE